jgi:DNA-binding MarR family transcriptional regulator
MNSIVEETSAPEPRRNLLNASIGAGLREVLANLTALNRQVGSRLNLKDVDLECLNFLDRHGPTSPTRLAKSLGLHPATLTGVLDRLEQAGWAARERASGDRRGVVVVSLRGRRKEVLRLYSGMNASIQGICAEFSERELERVAEFLRLAAAAGGVASEELAQD